MPTLRYFSLVALALLLVGPDARAQRRYGGDTATPRFGIGFDAQLTPPNDALLPEGLGVGIRGRIAVPVNTDLSFAFDAGLAGYVLGGQDDATYVFNPQASAILTLPRGRWARYVLGGIGGFIPLSDAAGGGGPALHAGIGWALPLNETSLYIEFDPALVIGEQETTVVIPARIGVIF